MRPKTKKTGLLQPLAWAIWASPDKLGVHPAVKDEVGGDWPRLLLITFADGALKISATRRPLTTLRNTANMAKAMRTWIDGALVSEHAPKLGRIQALLVQRLRAAGKRYFGNGIFEGLAVEEALAELAKLRDIEPPPPAPSKLPPFFEPTRDQSIPHFLRKGNAMQTQENAQLPSLVVADTTIRQDGDSRYCLNDLHKAAGGEKHHAPNEWMRNKQTIELIEELAKPGISGLEQNQPVSVVRGGSSPGTYVCKELVYAYAMWISPAFHLKVIRAFDALMMGRKPEVNGVSVHPEIARAARATAWRIAEQLRHLYLVSMGSARMPEDEERAWEAFSILMERVEKHLLDLAVRMQRDSKDPLSVSARIFAWRPQGWCFDGVYSIDGGFYGSQSRH